MKPFQYYRPKTIKDAITAVASDPDAQFIAGGTNLIDLMKRGIVSPGKIVDINHLPLKRIERRQGITRVGALALNSEVASHKLIRQYHPLLTQALHAGASGQLRNMATIGGNLLQKTRCTYFYDTALPCNKRTPASGCGAIGGINKQHAIFGVDEKLSQNPCIAVNPSDMNVALLALDAQVLVAGPGGQRKIALADFHRLPGEHPEVDANLERDELILGVEIPDSVFTRHIHYLKVRDRASYAFALVSVAGALDLDQNKIKSVRLVMGGVAHKPWRLYEAEKALVGQVISDAVFEQAASIAMQGSIAYEHNTYKLKLTPQAIIQALKIATSF